MYTKYGTTIEDIHFLIAALHSHACSPLLADSGHYEILAILVFDPLDALELGVNHEWPALTVSEDGGVFRGHAVSRKSFILPRSDVSIISQHHQRVQRGSHGNCNLQWPKTCNMKAKAAMSVNSRAR